MGIAVCLCRHHHVQQRQSDSKKGLTGKDGASVSEISATEESYGSCAFPDNEIENASSRDQFVDEIFCPVPDDEGWRGFESISFD